ncbi:urate hydroxylase PuuD [Maritimibacter sp. DP1N21-5]|uniref:urate hydroxylase PuuD n=1 Tax=Maritimibacter sp. DP1N21-5 TaxID=2836867 RepID=UPI001C46C9A7|nr:urate hydroxylase PuuD [Maritimibacter sp. DP1N21-5]MBV7409263.1 urate hydroxylase PuuD [Maritimibacter sp. DP1N21-5]
MLMTIFLDWLELAVRWTHVITAIAWIGSSFYFIALDLGLRPARDADKGVGGEAWQVHGGGFYFIQKYLVSPARMPDELTWFKWESYATWLSGAALLMLVYWVGGEMYLVDQHKMEMPLWLGIVISAASLTVGWLVYDRLCKSGLAEKPTLLMVLLFLLLMAMGWGYNQIFTGRAVMLHLGAFTATIMTANVFFIIMPNQRIVVADLIAGRTPDAKYGKIAKLRSTHNNYLTLPVIFLMLSNHYPLAFASDYNWLVAGLVFLMGVTIRHFFNTHHAHGPYLWWTWLVTALLFLAAIWLSTLGTEGWTYEEAEARAMSAQEERFASAEGFSEVTDIVMGRCSMCHAREPGWEGMVSPPKGVILETPADIAHWAHRIYQQAGLTDAMPPANVSWMEPAERAAIRAWFDEAG